VIKGGIIMCEEIDIVNNEEGFIDEPDQIGKLTEEDKEEKE
jgi:hypothetical protein